MNTPNDPLDPLLQSLSGETADLPARAAAAARRRSAQREQNRTLGQILATLLLAGVFIWRFLPSQEARPSSVAVESHSARETGKFEVARAPDVMPPGLDPEQIEVVKAAGDGPLLLVRNAEGKVTRIHFFER